MIPGDKLSSFLPTPPERMSDEHLRNSIAYHMRHRAEAQERIRVTQFNLDGYNYALGELLTEHARREALKPTVDQLKRRIELLETSNFALAEKVSVLSRRKPKRRRR